MTLIVDLDCTNEEFFNYGMLTSDAIPKSVKDSDDLREDDPHRVDVPWGYLRGLKEPGMNDP